MSWQSMENFVTSLASPFDRAPEAWKEDIRLSKLNRRFLWFLILRMGAVALLIVTGFFRNILIPHLSIASVDFFLIAGILIASNLAYWLHYRRAVADPDVRRGRRAVSGNLQAQIILDFLFLGYLVYECGGLESPLVYFFLFHDALSCLFFTRRVSFVHTAISIVIVVSIFLLGLFGVIPVTHFISTAYAARPWLPAPFAFYYLAGVVSIFLIAWYLVSSITKDLWVQEQHLQAKIEEMEELTREKTRYMLVTTHELKAPFAAIQSYVNVALTGYAGDVPLKIEDILRKIGSRCNFLSSMITEMIQLANLTSIKERRAAIEMGPVDLADAVAAAVAKFSEMAEAKGVHFVTAKPAGMRFEIHANREQIDILLNNIIGNAVVYSHKDTTVHIELKNEDRLVTAAVRDEGIGIRKEHMEKIFLEYFRSERAAELNPNSTGLGLTIAWQIMDIHRGRIRIESAENVGTCVFLEFPQPS